ncbi:methyltransferase domain-containing protein [Candidatus Thioglobus sp.]|nr:methyltransferase domain-containing protein [Candidatus Thioglobus sp.]
MKFFLDFLICIKCKSSDIDFSEVTEDDQHLLGFIKCRNCSSEYVFEEGVLNLLSESVVDNNELRNSEAYSDFWERGVDEAIYANITHENNLISSWSDQFVGKSFIDIGCGNGRHMHHWVSKEFDTLIFVDISNAIVESKKKFDRLRRNNQKAIFIKGSLNNIPIKKESIDVVWSSGTLGLVNDQERALCEMIRISKDRLYLSVLTDKTMAGKIYVAANVIKPLVNKITNFSILYKFAKVLAFFVFYLLKIMRFFRIHTKFLNKETLDKVCLDSNSIKRIQWGLYDPIIIPKIVKHPDEFYFFIAKKHGFNLDSHQTEIISDYYFFRKEV